MILHHTRSLQQTGNTEHTSQEALLVLKPIGWILGLNVLHQHLQTEEVSN